MFSQESKRRIDVYYVGCCHTFLFFLFFLNKSRIRYRKRDYREPKLFHGALVLLINIAFEVVYRNVYAFQPTQVQGGSVFLVYWLPQVIYYTCLITVLLALSYFCGLFIWPDTRNEINKKHSFNIPIFFLLSLFIIYPSISRYGLVESSPFMLAMILIADGFTSLYLVRILVIKFNK